MKTNAFASNSKGLASHPEIISHAVWLYSAYYSDYVTWKVEDPLEQREFVVTEETNHFVIEFAEHFHRH